MEKITNHSNERLRGWIILAVIIMTGVSLAGCPGQEKKVYHVGVLHYPGSFVAILDGFKAEMTELGYKEGENIVYDGIEVPQTAKPEEGVALAGKFVDDKVDLILAFPTPAVFAAFAATKGTDIPVVFAMANTEGVPFVKSVQEPGGNVTGVRNPGAEMMKRGLELLLEIAPHAKNIWAGYDKNHPNTPNALKALRPTAVSLGVNLVELPATTLDDFRKDLGARDKAAHPGIDAIVTMADGLNHGPEGFALLSKFAATHKIPLCGGVLASVQNGSLFGNTPSLVNVGELAAPLADKIFKGTPAGTIPVVTPEQELYINYKEAQRIGLTVPDTLLQQAKEIIR
jgi:putative ABC transport system substrate-binding protein